MGLKISILSDNTAGIGFLGEWGFSCLVERGDRRFLFDTGEGPALIHNARRLGIDLSDLDAILLSHGDDDHTRGLAELLTGRTTIPVIGHPALWGEKYIRAKGGTMEYTGIPHRQEALASRGMDFWDNTESLQLGEGMLTSGEIPLSSGFEQVEKTLFVYSRGSYHPDLMADELALYIETGGGLVIITGCSHRGIVNIIEHGRRLTGIQSVKAVLGGLHLFRAGQTRINTTIEALKGYDVQTLALCHCTGFPTLVSLSRELPDAFHFISTGTVLEW